MWRIKKNIIDVDNIGILKQRGWNITFYPLYLPIVADCYL